MDTKVIYQKGGCNFPCMIATPPPLKLQIKCTFWAHLDYFWQVYKYQLLFTYYVKISKCIEHKRSIRANIFIENENSVQKLKLHNFSRCFSRPKVFKKYIFFSVAIKKREILDFRTKKICTISYRRHPVHDLYSN